MNKYVSMFLQVLKYIGIFLLVVYLYLVVNFYNNPMTSNEIKDKSFLDRLEEAAAEALFVGVGEVLNSVFGVLNITACDECNSDR
jgi:hypothetical protein